MTEQKQTTALAVVKNYLANPDVKKRFEEMLGEKAGAFCTSMINVVNASSQLQACEPKSIMTAGLIAASLDLPIVPALGMAAMVPYGNQAQFQIMWRGVVQLCLRTNQYADIQCTEVYRDELQGYNPISGQAVFHPLEKFKLRYGDAKIGDVVGYYASFRLISGFEKKCYMSAEEVMSHARKYSKAYQYDLAKSKKASAWSTDPVAMGRKTVLLRLLGRWGIKSVQIEKALVGDKQDFEAAQKEAAERIAAETGSEIVDTEFEANGETGSTRKTRKSKKAGKKASKKVESKDVPKFKYHCSNCEAGFDEPRMTGLEENVASCPACKSLNVALAPDGETPDFMKED